MTSCRAALLTVMLALWPGAGTTTVRQPRTVGMSMRAQRIAVAAAETLAVFTRGFDASSVRGTAGERSARSATPLVLVLIPGPIGSAFSMRHITDALAGDPIPVVVIDPLGMGASARPPNAGYSLTQQARRIAAVLDSLHIARALLVAQGTSATIALHVAADNPARVSDVLSLAGGPIDHQGTSAARMALSLAPVLDNALGRAMGRRRFVAAMREQSSRTGWCTDEVVHAYLAPYERNLRASLRVLRAMSDAVEPVAIAVRLPGITARVRLLIGDKASASAPTLDQIQALRGGLQYFGVDTIVGAGTMVQEERADAVLHAIRVALTRTAAL